MFIIIQKLGFEKLKCLKIRICITFKNLNASKFDNSTILKIILEIKVIKYKLSKQLRI